MMEISGDYILLQEVMRKLLRDGYPSRSLIAGWRHGNRIYDLAVVDTRTRELLAVFELIVSHPVIRTSTELREKVAKYEALQAKAGVPLFVVTAVKGDHSFDIIQFVPLEGGEHTFLETKEFPPFEDIKEKTLIQKLSALQNTFRWLCWGIAVASLVLLWLDWFGILPLTLERIALIGVVIAMTLLPDLRKIKILGVEIERITE